MSNSYHLHYESPIGVIEIKGTNDFVCSIMFSEDGKVIHHVKNDTPKALLDCYLQLDEYFKGERMNFTFPYIYNGTTFQQTVWDALKEISYAETATYKNLATAIGNEKAIRAVGNANGKNKLSIVIPCHRIIGTNGKLTGYAGGLWRKQWLLKHEEGHRSLIPIIKDHD